MKPEQSILYVDDDHSNLVVFRSAFMDYFDVVTCMSAQEALTLCETRVFPVIIADQRMPEMKGVDFLEIVKEDYPFTIRIILTAYTDVVDVLDAINRGHVYKYITKPWRTEDVLMTLHRALEAYHLSLENHRLTEQLLEEAKFSVLGRFATEIAHEIRNQLGVITFTELIKEKYADDEMLRRYAEIMLDAQNHLLNIVGEVRDLSRGLQPDYDKVAVPLADVVRSTLSFLRYDKNFDGKEVITGELPGPVVICDKGKIRQVLMNILQNAAQATEFCDSAVIKVETFEEPHFGVVSITDNGCGIEPANIERIWEPFFTTQEEQGTGLGLDICRKILDAHGGRITCSSSPGNGTTFKIYIPSEV